MTQYDETNRGTLWFNYEKKNEKAPDYNLNVNIEGKNYSIAAWKKLTKDGKRFISFSIEEGDGKRGGRSKDTPNDGGGW